MLYEILQKYPEINPNWLLTGQGEMLASQEKAAKQALPPEEHNDKLSPAQREMLTYKRLQMELGVAPEKIAVGIEAIAMGKTRSSKSASNLAEPSAYPGYTAVNEPKADFDTDL
ncbi:hypothetical protein [Desulfovibrio inopinatus]|uniref:hypothetical protein n=1 Tax=Desulfovibrio inopinatus TaxID=102109 RepID=UPI0004283E99|nr:hypothetical protein [Desulfovibrio inopinatus]